MEGNQDRRLSLGRSILSHNIQSQGACVWAIGWEQGGPSEGTGSRVWAGLEEPHRKGLDPAWPLSTRPGPAGPGAGPGPEAEASKRSAASPRALGGSSRERPETSLSPSLQALLPGSRGGGEALMQRPQAAALRRDKRTLRTAPAWPSPGRRPVRPSEPVLGHRGPSVPGHLALPAPHAPGATPLCSLPGSSAEHRAGAPQASAHPGFEPASPRDMHGSPSLPLAGPTPTPSLGSHGAPSRRRPSPHLQASKRL